MRKTAHCYILFTRANDFAQAKWLPYSGLEIIAVVKARIYYYRVEVWLGRYKGRFSRNRLPHVGGILKLKQN